MILSNELSLMKNPLVVGYKGEIGSFILSGLLKIMPKALNIWCVDINETEDEVRERINISDVVFLCVPFEKTEEWLLKYKDILKDKLILEQCSLKSWIYDNENFNGLNIVSMHILYRPSQTPNIKDRSILFFKSQSSKIGLLLIKIIAEMLQSETVWVNNATEHDCEMAVQQALVHRILLTLGRQLKRHNTPTYIGKKILELMERIQKGDKVLYSAIQNNKMLPIVHDEFLDDLDFFNIDDFWK